MDYETMKFIFETRMKTAEMNGNISEQLLMAMVLNVIEENKMLKNKFSQGDE